MKIGYYPGCSMHGTSREFDESLKEVARAIGAELQEIDDWSCCGSSSAHPVSHRLAVALSARNLALAEAQGLEEVVAPCAACYNRLAGARHAVAEDARLAREMPAILGRPFKNRVAVRNVVQLLRTSAPAIREKVTRPLKGLKVACYYGCLLVRGEGVADFDDTEQPASMEEVVKVCGATPVKWNMALECCGGSFSISRTGSVVRLGRIILEDARKAGADLVLVACPMCHSNLDFRQQAMMRRGENGLPILFITELVGLALGLESGPLGLERHFVSTATVLAKLPSAASESRKEAH
jgi:heterodisulfide reductase subunit B2